MDLKLALIFGLLPVLLIVLVTIFFFNWCCTAISKRCCSRKDLNQPIDKPAIVIDLPPSYEDVMRLKTLEMSNQVRSDGCRL